MDAVGGKSPFNHSTVGFFMVHHLTVVTVWESKLWAQTCSCLVTYILICRNTSYVECSLSKLSSLFEKKYEQEKERH